MNVKDKIKLWIKSPFFWLVFAIVMIGLVILLVSSLSSKDPNCEGGKVPGCGGGCVPICGQDQIWNCDKKECECQQGLSPCGDTPCCRTCSVGKDGNKYCCPKSQICPVDRTKPQGAQKCCDSGEICNDDNVCTNACGLKPDGTGMLCKDPNTQCLRVDFTTPEQKNKFKDDFAKLKNDKGITFNVDGMVGYACVPPESESKCHFSENQNNFPSDVGDDVHLFIKDSSLVSDKSGDSGFCYTKKYEGVDCTRSPYREDPDTCKAYGDICGWYDPLKPDSTKSVSDMATEMQLITGNYGYYCNPDGKSYYRFASKKSDYCDAIDCWRQFANDQSSTDINYNYDTNICTIKTQGTPDDKFVACTDTTKKTCPQNMKDTTTKDCEGGAVKDKTEPTRYKCVTGVDNLSVCGQSYEDDAVADRSCDGTECTCPAGFTWFRGNSSKNWTDQGCYKDAFVIDSTKEAGTCYPVSGSCHNLGTTECSTEYTSNACGPGWTHEGIGTCAQGCTFGCKAIVPDGTFYCNGNNWVKCDKEDGCTADSPLFNNKNYTAHGDLPKPCFVNGPDTYCTMPT